MSFFIKSKYDTLVLPKIKFIDQMNKKIYIYKYRIHQLFLIF